MSAYTQCNVQFKRKYMAELAEAIREVIAERGVGRPEHVETSPEAQALRGYTGDRREQQAHVILRAGKTSGTRLSSSNDFGWEFKEDGTCVEHVSEYDQKAQRGLVDQIRQRYALRVARKAAKAAGWDVVEKQEGDAVRLTLKRGGW